MSKFKFIYFATILELKIDQIVFLNFCYIKISSPEVESVISLSLTEKRQLLQNTMITQDTSTSGNMGVFCNLDTLGNLMNNNNTIKLYIWVMNVGTNTGTFVINGCASSPATCSATTDYTVAISGGKSYPPNSWNVEIITLTKSTTSGNATIQINSGAVKFKINLGG